MWECNEELCSEKPRHSKQMSSMKCQTVLNRTETKKNKASREMIVMFAFPLCLFLFFDWFCFIVWAQNTKKKNYKYHYSQTDRLLTVNKWDL